MLYKLWSNALQHTCSNYGTPTIVYWYMAVIKINIEKGINCLNSEYNVIYTYLLIRSIAANITHSHPFPFFLIPAFLIRIPYTLLTYSLHGAESFLRSWLVLQLIKKFPAFYGIRKFITVLTSARHLSLSWAHSIQSPQPLPTSWRPILIVFSHLRLGLPNGLFPSCFFTKTFCTPLPSE